MLEKPTGPDFMKFCKMLFTRQRFEPHKQTKFLFMLWDSQSLNWLFITRQERSKFGKVTVVLIDLFSFFQTNYITEESRQRCEGFVQSSMLRNKMPITIYLELQYLANCKRNISPFGDFGGRDLSNPFFFSFLQFSSVLHLQMF